MSKSRSGPTDDRRQAQWFCLGASGLLQPLSEEFLYRSPEDQACHHCRIAARSERERDDVPR